MYRLGKRMSQFVGCVCVRASGTCSVIQRNRFEVVYFSFLSCPFCLCCSVFLLFSRPSCYLFICFYCHHSSYFFSCSLPPPPPSLSSHFFSCLHPSTSGLSCLHPSTSCLSTFIFLLILLRPSHPPDLIHVLILVLGLVLLPPCLVTSFRLPDGLLL